MRNTPNVDNFNLYMKKLSFLISKLRLGKRVVFLCRKFVDAWLVCFLSYSTGDL